MVVLADPPWGGDQRHNRGSLITGLVAKARKVIRGAPSPLSGLRVPGDYVGVLTALGESGWLSGPGENPWSTTGQGYSNRVLAFAYGCDQTNTPVKSQPHWPNEMTDTGKELFEEFTDLFFDLGIPLASVIEVVRKWCAAEILGPGTLSLRKTLKSNYFNSQGTADVVAAVAPRVRSREEAWAVALTPTELLPMEDLTDVFLSKVRRRLEQEAAGPSELGDPEDAVLLLHDLEQRFPGGGRRPGRTKNVPDTISVAEPKRRMNDPGQGGIPDEDEATIEAKTIAVEGIEALLGTDGGWSVCADTPKVLAEWSVSESRGSRRLALQVVSAALSTYCADPEGRWDGCVSAAVAYVEGHPELALYARDVAADARDLFIEAVMEAGCRRLRDGDLAFSADVDRK